MHKASIPVAEMSVSSIEKDNRKYFIDGLRGWASVVVLLHHVFEYFLSTVNPAYQSKYFLFITDGPLAVSVFFVLSGFALSTGYIHAQNPRIIITMASRRYIRLTIPILVSSLMAFALMSLGLMYNVSAASILNNDWLAQFYAFTPSLSGVLSFSLFDTYFNYDANLSYNKVLWTMPIEFFGSYVIFSMLLTTHHGVKKYCAYLAIFAVLALQKSTMKYLLFGMLLAEIYEMEIIHKLRMSRQALITGLCLIGAVIFMVTFHRNSMRHFLAVPLVLSAVLSGRIASFFENGLSCFLGRISFPLYLTHLLVICSLSSYLVSAHWFNIANSNYLAAITIILSLVLAVLFEPVERFSIIMSHKFSNFVIRSATAKTFLDFDFISYRCFFALLL